jgi:group I intron endonuclease
MNLATNTFAPITDEIIPHGVVNKPSVCGASYFLMVMILRTAIPQKASGIYMIRSIINGNRYIGSACNLKERRKTHFSELKRNIHRNYRLQNHVKEYGLDDLTFGIIELCPVEKLIEREQYWIDTLHLFTEDLRPLEFNIDPKAGSQLGFKFTEEQNRQNSERQKGEKNHYYGRTGDNHPIFGKNNKTPEEIKEIKKRMKENHANFKGENSPLFGYKFSEEQNKKNRESQIEIWSDPKYHERQSRVHLKYYEDHPQAKEHLRKTTKQYYEKHPEAFQNPWNKGLTKETDPRLKAHSEYLKKKHQDEIIKK